MLIKSIYSINLCQYSLFINHSTHIYSFHIQTPTVNKIAYIIFIGLNLAWANLQKAFFAQSSVNNTIFIVSLQKNKIEKKIIHHCQGFFKSYKMVLIVISYYEPQQCRNYNNLCFAFQLHT